MNITENNISPLSSTAPSVSAPRCKPGARRSGLYRSGVATGDSDRAGAATTAVLREKETGGWRLETGRECNYLSFFAPLRFYTKYLFSLNFFAPLRLCVRHLLSSNFFAPLCLYARQLLHTFFRQPATGLPATILFLLLALPCAAQQADTTDDPRSASVRALARAAADSVVLRWAPSTPGAWMITRSTGYIVERQRITENSELRTFERLTPAPLIPWTVEEWKSRSKPEQKFAAIAVQCLYGKAAIPAGAQSPVQQLRLAADELMNRYSFALFAADNDAHAANGLALRFVDRNVKSGEQYVYRIFATTPDPTYRIDTAYVVVDVGAAPAIPPPTDIAAEELDSLIILHWNNLPGNVFSGYYVERSDDNGGSYRRLNDIPVVPITNDGTLKPMAPGYDDSTIVNYKKYRYRVRGVTAFAEQSEPAEIEAMGRDRTPPPAPLMEKPLLPGGKNVILKWTMDKGSLSDLAGFVVARSAYPEQGFVQMFDKPLPPDARTFLDTAATTEEAYYMVGAVDTAGNVAASLPVYADLIDTIPPAPPTGLTGAIDTNGVVTLKWNLGEERDLLGYRVLWANDSTHEFAQLTPAPWQDTVYVDSVNINTLTPYVYYKIAAVDTRYLHSEATPILALRRPDIYPPEPSVFTNVFATDSSVVLSWEQSRSQDLASQILERRIKNTGNWQLVATLDARANRYTDTSAQQRSLYEYRLIAVDSTGFRTPSPFAILGRSYDTGRRAGITGLQAQPSEDGRTIALSWRYSAPNERHWFVLYRSHNGSPLRQYRAVESAQQAYMDEALVGDGKYEYAVRVMMNNGGESPLSESVAVEVKKK